MLSANQHLLTIKLFFRHQGKPGECSSGGFWFYFSFFPPSLIQYWLPAVSRSGSPNPCPILLSLTPWSFLIPVWQTTRKFEAGYYFLWYTLSGQLVLEFKPTSAYLSVHSYSAWYQTIPCSQAAGIRVITAPGVSYLLCDRSAERIPKFCFLGLGFSCATQSRVSSAGDFPVVKALNPNLKETNPAPLIFKQIRFAGLLITGRNGRAGNWKWSTVWYKTCQHLFQRRTIRPGGALESRFVSGGW